MEKVLLELMKKADRSRIDEWLGRTCQILLPDPEHPLEEECDLVIIDGPSLKLLLPKVVAKREATQPVVLPFLLLTARGPRSGSAWHLGKVVDDVVFRPLHRNEVRARVANLLRMRKWSEEWKKEHDRVAKLAVTDDVSGFNNTRYLHRYLDRLIGASNEKPPEVCLVFFDVDNFKRLVDTHGHLLGSKALKEVAQVVHRELDEDDRLVRYGGDEFIAILPRQNKKTALAKVSRMQEAIASTPFLHKEEIDARLTASFGLACFPDDAQDKHQLLIEADRCLFQSKDAGKDRVTATNGEPALA